MPPSSSITPSVSVQFLGGNTLWFNDGTTHLMVDPFFSRPGKHGKWTLLFRRVRPDVDAIAAALEKKGIQHLDALLFTHAHYDHAMDGAEVARLTGAHMVGSPSLGMVGRGAGMEQEKLILARPGSPLTFGGFKVTFFPAVHTPFPFPINYIAGLNRTVERPIVPPAYILAYRDGGVFAIMIEHSALKILVCGSGGFVEGALQGVYADVAFLCVGGLDLALPKYRRRYLEEMAYQTRVSRIFLTHWDDFSRPLTEESRLLPWTKRSMEQMIWLARERQLEICLMPVGKVFVL